MPIYRRPLFAFIAFNLIGAPLLGRIVSVMMMLSMEDGTGDQSPAVLISVVAILLILGINIVLIKAATRAGLPGQGQLIMWLITGTTFALAIWLGVFSPINLMLGLIGL